MPAFVNETHNAAEVNPITVSHTATGDDGFALIGVMNNGTVPASISYGAQTPTLIASNGRLHLYGLVAPAAGAQTVSVDSGTSQMQAVSVASFSGVDQSAPTRSPSLADNDEQTSISATPASEVGDLIADFALMINTAMGAAAGQTRIVDMDDPGVGFLSLGMSTKPGASPSTTMTWEAAETFGDNRLTAVALVPASGGSPATQLAWTTQPGNTVVGQPIAAVQVAAQDGDDELDESFTGNVTIALQTGSGTLAGTLTRAAVDGVATFNDLSINTLNTGAVLRATASGLTQADSSSFNITAGGGGAGGGSLIGSLLVSS